MRPDSLQAKRQDMLTVGIFQNPGRQKPFKKHACPTCGARFFQAAQLQTHQRSHTGEKPFVSIATVRSTTLGVGSDDLIGLPYLWSARFATRKSEGKDPFASLLGDTKCTSF